MAVKTFPTGYVDRVPSRTSKVMGDTGTASGNFVIQQILDLITLLDLPPGTATGDYPYWNGTQWVFGNDATVGELSVAAALANGHLFAVDQGGTDLVKASMQQLYTYLYNRLLATNVLVKTIEATVADYTFLIDDRNKLLRFMTDTGCTVRTPANFPVGWSCGWLQQGAGTLTFGTVEGSGQTLAFSAGLRSGARYSRGSVIQDAANWWNLSGFTMV